eukprot:scaffold532872_cov46-Prasinocladus_malaysianus.AAC.3
MGLRLFSNLLTAADPRADWLRYRYVLLQSWTYVAILCCLSKSASVFPTPRAGNGLVQRVKRCTVALL